MLCLSMPADWLEVPLWLRHLLGYYIFLAYTARLFPLAAPISLQAFKIQSGSWRRALAQLVCLCSHLIMPRAQHCGQQRRTISWCCPEAGLVVKLPVCLSPRILQTDKCKR